MMNSSKPFLSTLIIHNTIPPKYQLMKSFKYSNVIVYKTTSKQTSLQNIVLIKTISIFYIHKYDEKNPPTMHMFLNGCPLFTTFFETIKITKYLNKKMHQNKKLTIEDNVYCENPVMFTMQ